MTTCMVCVDCYFAHHYGAEEVDPATWAIPGDGFADGGTPYSPEPLSRLAGLDLADATDSETGEGIEEFSWSACEGCGSSLGGARYRLALLERPHVLRAPGECGEPSQREYDL